MISDYSAFSSCSETHTAGELLPKTDSVSSDNLSHSPVQASSFSQSRRDGGGFFAHYRRRLPAGSLCSTITALWGCLTEAKEREQRRQRVWRCLVGWYLFVHHSWVPSLSLPFGIESILLCPCFFHTQTLPLYNFSLFLSSSNPQTFHCMGAHYYKLMLHGQVQTNRNLLWILVKMQSFPKKSQAHHDVL